MSSNLTISYTNQTAAGTAPAASASASAAGSAGAPAADSPLGFLAALVDQLLAGGIETQAKTGVTTEASVQTALPPLLDLALGAQSSTSATATPTETDPLIDLKAQLDALKLQLDAGTTPAPDQIESLTAAIDALVAAPAPVQQSGFKIATNANVEAVAQPTQTGPVTQLLSLLGLLPQPQVEATSEAATPAAPTPVAITDLRNQLLNLSVAVAARAPAVSEKLGTLAAKLETIDAAPAVTAEGDVAATVPSKDAEIIAKVVRALFGVTSETSESADPAIEANVTATATAQPVAQVQDQLLQLLATLGIDTAQPGNAAPAPTAQADADAAVPAVTTAVPPALLRLSAQLTKLSSEIAATAPDLAKKLETVATRLVSVDADAKLQAQVTNAAGSKDGADLNALIQKLIDNKPVATPAPTTPQIAASAQLEAPQALVPTKPKSPIAEIKAAAVPTVATEPESVAHITQVKPVTAAVEADPLKTESKAAIVVAEAVKADTATQQPAANANVQPQAQIQVQTARALPAAYQPVANPINMGQVAFEMVHQIHQGNSRFNIRLDPPELGRVDVRMQVDQTGAVNARLIVERAETLDMFQRDQRSLERALAQAGLDSSKTNLEFSLRQNPFAGMTGGDQQRPQHQPNGTPRFSLDASEDVNAMPAITLYRGTASAGGVNLFV